MNRSFKDSTAEHRESKFLFVSSAADKGRACVVKGVMTGSAQPPARIGSRTNAPARRCR
jgi:hypothetical protein